MKQHTLTFTLGKKKPNSLKAKYRGIEFVIHPADTDFNTVAMVQRTTRPAKGEPTHQYMRIGGTNGGVRNQECAIAILNDIATLLKNDKITEADILPKLPQGVKGWSPRSKAFAKFVKKTGLPLMHIDLDEECEELLAEKIEGCWVERSRRRHEAQGSKFIVRVGDQGDCLSAYNGDVRYFDNRTEARDAMTRFLTDRKSDPQCPSCKGTGKYECTCGKCGGSGKQQGL